MSHECGDLVKRETDLLSPFDEPEPLDHVSRIDAEAAGGSWHHGQQSAPLVETQRVSSQAASARQFSDAVGRMPVQSHRHPRTHASAACGRLPTVRHSIRKAIATATSTNPHKTRSETCQMPTSERAITRAARRNTGAVITQCRVRLRA